MSEEISEIARMIVAGAIGYHVCALFAALDMYTAGGYLPLRSIAQNIAKGRAINAGLLLMLYAIILVLLELYA